MADYRAIAATCEAVIYLLRSNYNPDAFNQELEFKVYSAKDFAQPIEAGVSMFLYRIFVNGMNRSPAGRQGTNGRRHKNKLPLDLYFLLTAWGRDASLQQTITGWMMRTLEDTPVLPSGLLNTMMPETFDPSDTVELSLVDMSSEDLFHLWEIVGTSNYHLSIPYIARNVNIESTREKVEGGRVQERSFDYGQLDGGNNL